MLQKANQLTLGGDPEIFLVKDGKVLGSERFIPEAGISYYEESAYGKVIRDGVQAEITLGASYGINAPSIGASIRGAIRCMRDTLKKIEGSMISFNPLFEVSREELDQLSEKSRVLGCAPSFNLYGAGGLGVPSDYPVRSAGGHVHLGGLGSNIWSPSQAIDHRWRLVAILDAILGNTCVFIDQNPAQAERRKVYGRAGEHRLPSHGLEYRTLSNFWLRSWALTEFVMNMAKIGVDILTTSVSTNNDVEGELMNPVNIDQMQKAINGNDIKLAKETFDIVTGFLAKHLKADENPLEPSLLPNFDRFVDAITVRGIDAIFPNAAEVWLKEECQVGAWKRLLRTF